MLKFKPLIAALLLPVIADAQQQIDIEKKKMMDSVRAERVDAAALLYPRIRQFSITHQEQAVGSINSKLYGNDFFEGKFRVSRTTINMNIPILERKKSNLSANLGVIHQFFYISDITSYDAQHPVSNMNTYIPMLSLGINYMQRDTLFGKPVMFNAAFGSILNPSLSRSQFTFTGLISFPIYHSENSNLNGGVVIVADPSSPVPAFIFLNYFHKFKAIDVDLMVDIPYKIALRKQTTKKTSLSFSNELAGSNSFFEFNNTSPVIPEKMTFSTLEIKSGLLFEYRLTKKAVLSLSTGINYTANSKILESNAKPNDYFIKNKNKPVPYFQVGFSLLPFWKGLAL